MAEFSSPYLKPNRLADVIAALQFLGRYEDYKRTAVAWEKKMASTPAVSANNWGEIFSEHPEFFRVNSEKKISLLYRRATEHVRTNDGERIRPPLDDQSIFRLIDIACVLHSNALRSREEQIRNSVEKWRWQIQVAIQLVTAFIALAAAVLAAIIRVSMK